MSDEHIFLFDEHKFNLMTIYLFDEFCYQKPTIIVGPKQHIYRINIMLFIYLFIHLIILFLFPWNKINKKKTNATINKWNYWIFFKNHHGCKSGHLRAAFKQARYLGSMISQFFPLHLGLIASQSYESLHWINKE